MELVSPSPFRSQADEPGGRQQIATYEPACLIVGTRGRSLNGLQGLLPGSVSKYCLQNSPVPVVVVRSGAKREKKKKKRLADPTRRSYADVMSLDGTDMAGHVLRTPVSEFPPGGASLGDAEQEAAAVRKAIGIPGPDAAIHVLRGTSRSASRQRSVAPMEREEGETLRAIAGAADTSSPEISPGRVETSASPESSPSPAMGSGDGSPEMGEAEVREGVQKLVVSQDKG